MLTHKPSPRAQCVCEWGDRDALFVRLDGEVRRELAAGRVPPVQPFHAMAYPFTAELALAISMKCVAANHASSCSGMDYRSSGAVVPMPARSN